MQLIKLVFESLCRSLIRFFDNRFVANNDVEWYRMELEKQRLETQSLYERIILILEPRTITGDVVEEVNLQPIGKSKFKSWEQKRRELENESRLRAINIANEARMNIERGKSTEELEDELGISNG